MMRPNADKNKVKENEVNYDAKALAQKAQKALYNDNISDIEADTIITEINGKLLSDDLYHLAVISRKDRRRWWYMKKEQIKIMTDDCKKDRILRFVVIEFSIDNDKNMVDLEWSEYKLIKEIVRMTRKNIIERIVGI